MVEKNWEVLEQGELAQSVQDLASVFNLSDVRTRLVPGQGWSCAPDPEEGIVINMDPDQIPHDGDTLDPVKVLFVGRHELQHADDMLDPDWKYQPDLSKISATDSFFWNLVHDITIDGRTVKDYSSYREVAPELYEHVFDGKDALKEPKHIQLMKGLRVQSVLDDPSAMKVASDVQEAIDGLRSHEGHDLTNVLIHKGTSLQQRIALAEKFIKPVYDRFYEEEKEQNSDNDLEQQARDALKQSDMTQQGSGGNEGENDGDTQGETFEEQLQKATEEYQESSGQDEGENEEGSSGEEDENDGSGDTGDESGHGQARDENTLEKIGKKLLQVFERDKDEPRHTGQNQETLEEMIGQLGGTIKKELRLDSGNAEAYARALLENRRLILEAAEVFKHLARINQVHSRLRYNEQALPEGERLHTGRLPQAQIEASMGIPMDVWRGKERTAPKIVRQFSGLDIQLHIDASLSMNGDPAQNAAEMSLVLIEGLLLARSQQEKEVNGRKPDVRLSSMIFAGGTETIMPLSYDPSPQDRASVFVNTRKAGQQSTLVNPGLRIIFENARQNPARDVIGIVISDNMFGDEQNDTDPAKFVHSAKPANCTLINFSLGAQDALSVGKYSEQVQDTSQLPSSLLKVLQNYERQFYG